MPMRCRYLGGALFVMSLAGAAALGGCGTIDGVELQGGVFDALGVSSSALAAKQKEPQVPARPGIVLPPVPDRLPQPGSAAPDMTQLLPNDEDERKVRAAADAERRHKQFCDKALTDARIRGDADTIIQGPAGPCNPSILGQTLHNLNQPTKR